MLQKSAMWGHTKEGLSISFIPGIMQQWTGHPGSQVNYNYYSRYNAAGQQWTGHPGSQVNCQRLYQE